jgi:hypothetical protein
LAPLPPMRLRISARPSLWPAPTICTYFVVTSFVKAHSHG